MNQRGREAVASSPLVRRVAWIDGPPMFRRVMMRTTEIGVVGDRSASGVV